MAIGQQSVPERRCLQVFAKKKLLNYSIPVRRHVGGWCIYFTLTRTPGLI